MNDWTLAFRLARRDLRRGPNGGLRRFWVFLACLALGVAAIAAVGSVSAALRAGLRDQGRVILGGDVALTLVQRPASPAELTYLEQSGRLSQSAELRAMMQPVDGNFPPILVQIKAVDRLYPLAGAPDLAPALPMPAAFRDRGLVLDETLMRRLHLRAGDRVRLGAAAFAIRAALIHESTGGGDFQFGPTALIALDDLPATQLLLPGSLVNRIYRINMPRADLAAWKADLDRRFPDAGWRVRDRDNGAPGLQQFIDRMGMFLSLVGLTSLLVGGVGVGNAVRAWLNAKTETIAILKSLGAPAALIFRLYLAQILALAAAGIAAGLALGAGAPFVFAALLRDRLPVPPAVGVYPLPLALAAVYGILTALIFALWPLARAREISPARLFRNLAAPERKWPRPVYVLATLGLALAMAALAVGLADRPKLALQFLGGSAASFTVLGGLAWGLRRLAAALPRPRNPYARLALANLHRPGAALPSVVLSLGLGLTLLMAVAQVQLNLSAQMRSQLPDRAPAYFFLDVPAEAEADFRAAIAAVPGAYDLSMTPMLSGQLVRVAGVPADQVTPAPDAAWVLRGDRRVTFAATPPPGGPVEAGAWWPSDYAGPPLISFDVELARGLGVKIGDTLTLNILGREIEGRIANLRRIDWRSMGINFAVVFSPHAFDGAPFTWLATVKARDQASEDAILAQVTRRLPMATAVRMKEILATVNGMVGQIAAAVQAVALVSIASGLLVLAGAAAAGHRQRVYDAVILKVLGAARPGLMTAYLLEWALLGAVTALVAAGLGTLAGWAVVDGVMNFSFRPFPLALLATGLAGVAATVLFGLAGAWAALGASPNQVLRGE